MYVLKPLYSYHKITIHNRHCCGHGRDGESRRGALL
jgi:hypothetical protein